nr:hypothetical protein [Tanacetum cinerariifolium]
MGVHSAPPALLSDGQRTMLLCLLMQKQSGYNIRRPVGLWRWSEDNASMFVDAKTIRVLDYGGMVGRLFKDEATEEKGVRTKMASLLKFIQRMLVYEFMPCFNHVVYITTTCFCLNLTLFLLVWASFVGAMVIADLVKMTLGPKRLAKLVENLREGIENGTRDQHFDSPATGCEVASDIHYNVEFVKGVITVET